MIKSNKHIINKVYLEINTTSKEQGYAIKDNIDRFLKEHVFPQIESRFDSIDKSLKNDVIRIEKLDLNVTMNGDFKYDDVGLKITNGIEEAVQEKMSEIIGKASADIDIDIFLSNKQSNFRAFFYFLEKGTTAWWSKKESFTFLSDTEVLQEIIETDGFERLFQQKMKQIESRRRFVQQFSDQSIKIILSEAFTFDKTNELFKTLLGKELLKITTYLTPPNRTKVWTDIIQFLQTNDGLSLYRGIRIQKDFFKGSLDENNKEMKTFEIENSQGVKDSTLVNSWFDKVIKLLLITFPEIRKEIRFSSQEIKSDQKSIDQPIENKTSEFIGESDEIDERKIEKPVENQSQQDSNETIDEKGYYIENAGLILIHPFIKHFFEHCELLNEDGEINTPELAVHLLHYVTTKRENQPEHQMICEKFLCNVPIHESINRNIIIPKKLKDQSEELLQAVVQNWGALKNASPDLLRNEFIQRPGKLALHENNPKIIVERKTQDILLDRLPWNISIVKLPWKDKLIYVDW